MNGGRGEENRGRKDKLKREHFSLMGTIHLVITRDETNNLIFLFLSLLFALNHATHGSPCVPSSLISVSQAALLYSPGTDPDIWRRVKSNVLSGFLLKLEANTEIFNAEY